MVSEVFGFSVLVTLTTVFVLGSRHGFDWDHLTAIMDITSTQTRVRSGVALGFLYAVGHAVVVVSLGLAVLLLGIRVHGVADVYGGPAIGLTMILLGVYVFILLLKHRGPGFRMRTRIILLADAILYLYGRLRNWLTGQSKRPPQVFSKGYGTNSAFVVGMVHGVGGETPTQIAIFSVGLGLGLTLGALALVIFVAGLVIANTMFAVFSSSSYRRSLDFPKVYRYVATCTATLSLIIGVTFISGLDPSLPAIIPA